MRHLKKLGPSRPGFGMAIPDGNYYYPLQATMYIHHDEFTSNALDADEWTNITTTDSAGAGAITVAASIVTLAGGATATGSTSNVRFRSSMSADGNLYTIPFRVTWTAAFAVTAGAGISATPGGLEYAFAVRSTDDTFIAQFRADCSTAGSSSLASPVLNMEVRAGSTAAGFIASSSVNIWNTAANVLRTATAMTGYVIEITHRGTWFGYKDDVTDFGMPRSLGFFANPALRPDLTYYLDTRLTSIGTAGHTLSAGAQLLIDSITVEQLAPLTNPTGVFSDETRAGSIRSVLKVTASASESSSLVVPGSGVLLGLSFTSTATAAITAYAAAWDASAGSTAIYDYTHTLHSSGARLLWIGQVLSQGSTPTGIPAPTCFFPANGIPFQRGLVVAETSAGGFGVGSCSLNVLATYLAHQ